MSLLQPDHERKATDDQNDVGGVCCHPCLMFEMKLLNLEAVLAFGVDAEPRKGQGCYRFQN